MRSNFLMCSDLRNLAFTCHLVDRIGSAGVDKGCLERIERYSLFPDGENGAQDDTVNYWPKQDHNPGSSSSY